MQFEVGVDLKDLQAFLAVSNCLHLGKASAQLHMSASTLSRRLSRIEAEAGARLFERDSSPLQITPEGEVFRHYAEHSLLAWQQLKNALSTSVSNLSGSITLYCSVTASYSFLTELLSRFREKYPNVDLRIHTGDAAESIPRVQSGEADVVIAARPEQLPDALTFKGMATSPLLFIAPKNTLAISELSLPAVDWSKVPMVLAETGLARTRVNRWFSAQGMKPQIYAQVTGHEAIVSMVALGVGVGVVPELVLKNSPLANRVRVLAVQPELEPFSIGLCAQSQRINEPLLQALWKTAI
ncbi:MAG: HTH-type transcriptional activator IlvY [Venatoribacter sp.]